MRTWTSESCKLGFLLWVHFIVCTVGEAEFGRFRAREEMLSELQCLIIVINPDDLFSLVELSSHGQFYKPAKMIISELPTNGCFSQRELSLGLPRPFWSCINLPYWSDVMLGG